ncbi:ABC transporter permease subunit [Promineifilum sp.]|uniref:ABC transporter permease subunit n=1 Tax=Promineifilum sp. TaxID=2664178 RepID=UPI0035AE653F
MAAIEVQPEKGQSSQRERPTTVTGSLLRILGLIIFDAFALFFIYLLLSDGYWPLAGIIGFITLVMNYIFLAPGAYPMRWMSPGLAFMLLISVYPILFTIYISFTNFGASNLLPKVQAIEVLEQRTFLPETGATLQYTVFRNDETGEYGLWLIGAEDSFFATVDDELTAEAIGAGALDADGIPTTIPGWTRLSRAETVRNITAISATTFGLEETAVSLTGRLGEAAQLQQRFVWDEEQNAMIDMRDNVTYFADEATGFFTAEDGTRLTPGYQVTIGLQNYQRFLTDPSFRGPLLRIFAWNVTFALLSVLFSFALGLMIAIVFGRTMPGQRIIKSLLIIPFAVPQVITLLVWRGILNPLEGVVPNMLQSIFNQPVGWPPFFADPTWVKVALIVINVWLAYPYFMLISSGALQAIPTDMYEAADIDGASAWQAFRHMTLPLLLVAVGPLLISSFTVNFNSFNVIYLFNSGGPPMVGTALPAGHSDILISYVYNLAFGRGLALYGYASAITIMIFFMMVIVTIFQHRRMASWEETTN